MVGNVSVKVPNGELRGESARRFRETFVAPTRDEIRHCLPSSAQFFRRFPRAIGPELCPRHSLWVWGYVCDARSSQTGVPYRASLTSDSGACGASKSENRGNSTVA